MTMPSGGMTDQSDAMVRRWLFAAASAVALAVVIGGITRLTESGLSITEWKPVSGVLPPLSGAEWETAYRSYLAIPEAQTVHRGISLGHFQALYWWEWVHRMLARLVGLVLALPYFVLLLRGRLRPGYRARLLLLPILAAAQGALGWYMVKSGLEVRLDVSPYRLTAHLGLALVLFAVCVWTALDLNARSGEVEPARLRLRLLVHVGLCLAVFTLLSGAFVAGLDAGKIYNTFPLMGGHVVPTGYFMPGSGWRNAFENPVAAQFHHRVLALTTATLLLVTAAVARRPQVPSRVRQATALAALAVLLQVALGITTLLLRVPVAVGVLHQLVGLLLLTALLLSAHRVGVHASAHGTGAEATARMVAGRVGTRSLG